MFPYPKLLVLRGRLARTDYEFLMNNRKHEERTIGNFLMSVRIHINFDFGIFTVLQTEIRRGFLYFTRFLGQWLLREAISCTPYKI